MITCGKPDSVGTEFSTMRHQRQRVIPIRLMRLTSVRHIYICSDLSHIRLGHCSPGGCVCQEDVKSQSPESHRKSYRLCWIRARRLLKRDLMRLKEEEEAGGSKSLSCTTPLSIRSD
jgi:hypothetical protein